MRKNYKKYVLQTIYSLLNLVNNLAECIHKIKCKYGHDIKCETCWIKYKDCDCCLEYTRVKDERLVNRIQMLVL